MVRIGDPLPKPPHVVAKELSDAGLQVFPARYRDKAPLVKWQQYQGQNVSGKISDWFEGRGKNLNFWVMTGHTSGVIVIDCDTPEAEAWWRNHLGEALDATTRVKTSKGNHYYFRIPPKWENPIPSWSVHNNDENVDFDLRADNTGVIAPPSVHESGFKYEWAVPLSAMQEAPLALLDGSIRAVAPRGSGASEDDTVVGAGGVARSMLSRLLDNPPGAEGSGRNDWLAKVAGHYAKHYHNQQDLYETHCRAANRLMGEPLDTEEYRKTVDSVWRGEHERNSHRALDIDCGFLQAGDHRLLCQVMISKGDDKVYDVAEYADFDMKAKGVMVDEAGRRAYLVSLTSKRERKPIDVVIKGGVFGDPRALNKLLSDFGVSVSPPEAIYPKNMLHTVRLQRYLESQQPPVVFITEALGWDDDAVTVGTGGFVTHDGVITADGILELDEVAVRADPRIKAGGMAPHEYGFDENATTARHTLSEVLTFHDEHVTSVFGAWWAACLLKEQIQRETSLFPFMAIEAPSESGKTNGFFSQMLQLNGNTRGEMQPTKAALRDMAAAHKNGAVWIDDLDDPAYLMELLRAATSGGSLTKMGEDRESVKNTKIVSPIVISGEALGLNAQKALVDRAILLKAPSPTKRRSLHDPDKAQWDDILAVRRMYPRGLHTIAGWFVQDALTVVDDTLAALREASRGGSGRASDKVAVLRAGARLLDYLVRQDGAWDGQGQHAVRLEEWLSNSSIVDSEGKAVTSNENALSVEVLPWALRKGNFPDQPTLDDPVFGQTTPAFVKNISRKGQMLFDEDVEVWFHPALLAEAWERHKHGRVERRTHTEGAFKDQAKALHSGSGKQTKQWRVTSAGGTKPYYWKITGDAAVNILNRAIGES